MILEEQNKERQLLERFRLALETEEDKETFNLIDSYYRLGLQSERKELFIEEKRAEAVKFQNKVLELNEEIRTLKVLRDLAEKVIRLEDYL